MRWSYIWFALAASSPLLGQDMPSSVVQVVGRLKDGNAETRKRACAQLLDLGPRASTAVPHLYGMLLTGVDEPLFRAGLGALAELAPYRASDVQIDVDQLWLSLRLWRRIHGLDDGDVTEVGWRRLRRRVEFPRDATIGSLVAATRAFDALRVEAAVDLLATRGPSAREALSDLQRLLARPEPRILGTELAIPLHRKSAGAIVAIAPTEPIADTARSVLAGQLAPTTASVDVPERARRRVAEVVQELAVPEQRAAAKANLLALGRLSALPIIDAVLRSEDDGLRAAGLEVLQQLGPRAVDAVPKLFESFETLGTQHALAVMETLIATAPWSFDVPPSLRSSMTVNRLEVFGRHVPGPTDPALLTEFGIAGERLRVALEIDPASSLEELENHLTTKDVRRCEQALVVLRERGAEGQPLLPLLRDMLTATFPKADFMEWIGPATVRASRVDRSAEVRRLVAEAIVAIAAKGDPILQDARALLGR